MLLQVTFIETRRHCKLKCITIDSSGVQHDQSSLLLLLQKITGPKMYVSDNKKKYSSRWETKGLRNFRRSLWALNLLHIYRHYELSTTTMMYHCHQCEYTITKTVTLLCLWRKYSSFFAIWIILWNTYIKVIYTQFKWLHQNHLRRRCIYTKLEYLIPYHRPSVSNTKFWQFTLNNRYVKISLVKYLWTSILYMK